MGSGSGKVFVFVMDGGARVRQTAVLSGPNAAPITSLASEIDGARGQAVGVAEVTSDDWSAAQQIIALGPIM